MHPSTNEVTHYHVISRGNNRADVFHSYDDRASYLELLIRSSRKENCRIHHFVMMTNHVHLEVSTEDTASLASFMKRLNEGYSWRHKRRYERVGHLWQNRYRRFPITTDAYLLACGIYIELNPVRAGMVERPEDFAWSSHRRYAGNDGSDWITPDPAFLALGTNDEERRAAYANLMEMWLQYPATKKDAQKFFTSRPGLPHPNLNL